MSIESKHSYRFGYLKSEQWKNVRIEALAREHGKCQICGEESLSNDAHHVWYPENIYETTEKHLVVLCRPCHEFLHVMLPTCKTNDEESGIAEWQKFRNAITNWRREKICLFQTGIEFLPAKDLRIAYEDLKKKHVDLIAKLSTKGITQDGELSPQQEYDILRYITKKWWEEKKILTGHSKCANGSDSCVVSTPRNDLASL